MINQALIKRVLFLALILSLLPFLTLTIFTNPAYDDYCYASATLEGGLFNAQRYWFTAWSGRYFSNALLSLNPIAFGSFTGYKAIALITILTTFISVFCFVTAIFNSSVTLIEKLIAAAFITALFSNQMPDITEGYYWLPGSVSYQLASALTLFFFALVKKSLESSRLIKVPLLALSFILIIAIVGSNETSMIILLFLVCSVTIKAFSIKSKNRWIWMALLVITILCSGVVLFSPGNAIRSAYSPNRHRLLFSLGMSLAQEIRFLVKWVSNPAFALSTILFIPIAYKLSNSNYLSKNRLNLHPLTSLVLLLTLVFAGFFTPYWAMGLLGQHRTVNTVFFFFLLGWFANIIIWTSYLREKRKVTVSSLPNYFYLIGLPLIVLALLSTNNSKAAIEDLITSRAYRYDQEMRKRHSQFEQCAKQGIVKCQIEKIDNPPETISNDYFENEIDCEQQYWKFRIALRTSL